MMEGKVRTPGLSGEAPCHAGFCWHHPSLTCAQELYDEVEAQCVASAQTLKPQPTP